MEPLEPPLDPPLPRIMMADLDISPQSKCMPFATVGLFQQRDQAPSISCDLYIYGKGSSLFKLVFSTVVTSVVLPPDLSLQLQCLSVSVAVVDDDVEELEEEVEDAADDIEVKLEDELREFEEVIEEHLEAAGDEVTSLRQEVQMVKHEVQTGLRELRQKAESNEEEIASLKQQVQALTKRVEDGNNALTMKMDNGMNSTLYVLQEMKEQLRQVHRENLQSCGRDYEMALLCLPTSCAEIAEQNPGIPSGNYVIKGGTGTPVQVYCDMDRQSCSCSNKTVWMRVANLDMTDPAQQCPTGFTLTTSNSKRMCTRTVVPSCTSINFPVHGVQYSKVCGRVRGYQQHSTDAFARHGRSSSSTIDGNYVDGVSITHGDIPRKHIWTFASAHGDESYILCPCIRPSTAFTRYLPPFVENDYFCETGSRSFPPNRILYEDPLWDGKRCGSTTSCCQFNSPPWFCKDLPQPTTDDIEARVCTNESRNNEDLHIELIELYVQ